MFETDLESLLSDEEDSAEQRTTKKNRTKHAYRGKVQHRKKRNTRNFKNKRKIKLLCKIGTIILGILALVICFTLLIDQQTVPIDTNSENKVHEILQQIHQTLSTKPMNEEPSVSITSATEQCPNVKTILAWEPNIWKNKMNFITDRGCDPNIECEYPCIVYSLNDYIEHYESLDAIVFQAHDHIHLTKDLPIQRTPQQLYVYDSQHLLPPPVPSANMNFYNVTMTYRLNSDIIFSRYKIAKRGTTYAPALQPHWWLPKQLQQVENYTLSPNELENKISLALIVLKRPCNNATYSYRLYEELKNYIDIDEYGECGTDLLPIEDSNSNYDKYKFHLIFEDILCEDYVSDEFYQAMNKSVVPVVFGGANYTYFAPPQSYINADDFDTIRELGEYLTHLNEADAEYLKYLWWRPYYYVTEQPTTYCDLCTFLHKNNFSYEQERSIGNNSEGSHNKNENWNNADLNRWVRERNECHNESHLFLK